MQRTSLYDGPTQCAFIWHVYLSFLPHASAWAVSAETSTNKKKVSDEEADAINNPVTFCYVMNLWTLYLTAAFVKVGLVPSFVTGEKGVGSNRIKKYEISWENNALF